MADFRTANLNPFLRGTDRGLGLTQLPATCVPTSVSLQVLGTGPDHVCSQTRDWAIQGFSFPSMKANAGCPDSCLLVQTGTHSLPLLQPLPQLAGN